MPRIRLIAGPNGAGKTTLLRTLVQQKVPVGQYINPDDIARHIDFSEILRRVCNETDDKTEWPSVSRGFSELYAALLAQAVALGLRQDWLGHQLSLTYESVMSHESHLTFVDEAVEAGFEPYLYYICTSSPELHKARVRHRVKLGGHDVPEEKIEARYWRSLEFLEQMSHKCKRVYFFDNSGKEHLHFAEITPDGHLDIFESQFEKAQPSWFVKHLLRNWPREKVRLASF